MYYATISIFGQPKNLCRETLMKYMVNSTNKPQNYPIYSVHYDMYSFILCNLDTRKDNNTIVKQEHKESDNDNIFHESRWHLDFDGLVNRLGVGAGVWIHNIESNNFEAHAFRVNFKCTINMAEYEALILRLQIIRNLGAKSVSIMGDSELIIKKIKGEYSVNNYRLS